MRSAPAHEDDDAPQAEGWMAGSEPGHDEQGSDPQAEGWAPDRALPGSALVRGDGIRV
jgi:hypothetical protein